MLSKKRLSAEIYLLTGAAWVCIFFISFQRLASWLGTIHSETLWNEAATQDQMLLRIRHAVHRISKKTWWKSECFVRASTIAWMLRRRGYSYTIYLGVAKDQDQHLIAHAWIRSGSQWLSGAKKRAEYTVVATISYVPPQRKMGT